MAKPSLIQSKFPLNETNSWKVGGVADHFCEPTSVEELKQCWAWAHENKLPITVYSSGTNVLISDDGIRGLTINMRKFVGLEDKTDEAKVNIKVLSGTPKSQLLKIFLKHKLHPALFLTGLPGDVGGGVVMNAGVSTDVKPKEFGEIVKEIEVLTPPPELKLKTVKHDQITWEYRHTEGWQPGIVVSATVEWPMKPDEAVMNLAREGTRRRVQSQPLDKPSGGSTFRNPPGHKAGMLIEKAGLKGHRIGGAEVSTKHANFIVTEPGTLAADVDSLITFVKLTVLTQFNVELQTEVVYLGDWKS